MKIAYLSTFYPFRGGIAQFNAALYREFEKKHQIKAFTFTTQYPNFLFPGSSQFVSDTDIADKINSERILSTINPLSYLKTANQIKKYQPEILIMKFWMPFFAPSLGWVASSLKKTGTTTIAILDNVIPHEKRPFDISLIKYFLSKIDINLVMSNTVKNDLLSLIPNAFYKDIIHPLYNHFPNKIPKNQAREKYNIPNDKKVLLFFGFIRDYKGLDLLIQSLAELGEDYHLIIAGEVYGDFSKYQEQIQSLNLNNQITQLVRYISDDEVPFLFSASDLCVLPYKDATQSGIVGISYHYDLPIVATNVGSLAEMILPYKTGLISDSVTSSSLTASINDFFSSGIELYKNNILSYKKIANWEVLTNQIIDAYKDFKSKN